MMFQEKIEKSRKRHVFLEINAGGEWFWLQRTPGLPIAEAIAETLIGEGR